MGTTTTDKTTNQYNQQGMGAYNQMTPAMGKAATGYISNPFGNPFYQQQQQMGMNQANQMGQRGMSNLMQNFNASGMGGGAQSPFMQEEMANQGRATSGMQANMGFLNPTNNALQMQQNSMGLAAGYRPLQTGQTSQQSTQGLGTWLPQVAGAALGGITGGMSGGIGGALNGIMGRPAAGGGGGGGGMAGVGGGWGSNMPGGGNYQLGRWAGGGFGGPPQFPQMGGGGYSGSGGMGGMTPWLQ